jgi:pimeloyl-ACP methyl ester carboxylesterase
MTKLLPPRSEGTIRLRDGRKLGYAEFGTADGVPLIWFHGTPGARRQVAPESRRLALEKGVRIICVERPGVGDSSPHRYQHIAEYAEDIEQFADALALDTFAVGGLSGGGPYTLACAARMPERVFFAAVLGGVAPTMGPDAVAGPESASWLRIGTAIGPLHRPMGGFLRGAIYALTPIAEQCIKAFSRVMPEADQRVFADPLVRQMFLDDLILGGRINMQALFLDARLFARDWGFRLGDITVPVYMLYGDADTIVPLGHGHDLASRIPGSNLRIRTDAGHIGGLEASAEILDVLLDAWHESQAADAG